MGEDGAYSRVQGRWCRCRGWLIKSQGVGCMHNPKNSGIRASDSIGASPAPSRWEVEEGASLTCGPEMAVAQGAGQAISQWEREGGGMFTCRLGPRPGPCGMRSARGPVEVDLGLREGKAERPREKGEERGEVTGWLGQ